MNKNKTNNKRLNKSNRLNISHCTDNNNTGLEERKRDTNNDNKENVCFIYFSPVEKRKTIAVDKPTEKR
jgi:hypothetical protein